MGLEICFSSILLPYFQLQYVLLIGFCLSYFLVTFLWMLKQNILCSDYFAFYISLMKYVEIWVLWIDGWPCYLQLPKNVLLLTLWLIWTRLEDELRKKMKGECYCSLCFCFCNGSIPDIADATLCHWLDVLKAFR